MNLNPISSRRVQPNLKPLPTISNIIAVASGKGGVGKSTVTAMLALGLAASGRRVGILDADIYGPSQPWLFGVEGQKPQVKNQHFLPIISHNIQLMSMGFLVDTNRAAVWRGPMVSKALQQMLNDTTWDNLDYLLVDLPPGTGDIQLTMAQKIPVAGALVVTTPQDLSLIDARKAVAMFEKVSVNVLGIIENMSTFTCPECHTKTEIFGHGAGQQLAKEAELQLLSQLPLSLSIRQATESNIAQLIKAEQQSVQQLVKAVEQQLSQCKKDYSLLMPKVVETKLGSQS